ncbi:CG0192-related protein [Motilibacter aurantiacus]|uniref:CG0192-related protein n=1 Tax=Motilibacter aurantiacus TaxID=2714955 RepID=UPI00140A3BE6|nr:hypothetical protein [Motilibacter aurantiacus]NHC47048.1 hypothetical protein [Motilibacter aurantiacus]
MALIHQAELRPTKLELLADWLPAQRWYAGSGAPARVGAYRFDDPDGEVGIETFLVRAGDGPVLQVPLTYRAAPLEGAQDRLVGTIDHSVLGQRWVYDGCHDPVYVAALAAAIRTGSGEAVEYVAAGGRLEARASLASVRGSGAPSLSAEPGRIESVDDGDPTLVRCERLELAVVRAVAAGDGRPGGAVLTGSWDGQAVPVLLAYALS